MSVTEIKQAMGEWSLALKKDTPRDILDAITYFGHIAIIPASVQVKQYGDNLLNQARYVGVYRGRSASDQYELHGSGMAFWLGDEDGKGDVLETPVVLTAQTFANSMTALLPPGGSVIAGTITAVAGTYTGRHVYETPRSALTYVADSFSTPTQPAEWRVTNDAKLDAGLVSALYVTDPKAVLTRKPGGRDLLRANLPGRMSLAKDAEDLTTRVVLLAEGEGETIQTGSADAVGVVYKDLRNNTVKFTRVASESDTATANADARAQLMLNRFSSGRTAVELSSSAYDIKRDFVVGDYIYVYDPDNGFTDAAVEITWQGERINPVKLRCTEMTWPIERGYTVAFRDYNGVWYDLTPYYLPESGDTTIVVGDLAASLTGVGGEPIGTRPSVDLSTPATPTFNTPFSSVAYQSEASQDTRATAYLTWNQPLNADGSTILDGSHYEVRYRAVQLFNYPTSWAQIGGFTNAINSSFTYSASSAWNDGWTVAGGAASNFNVDGADGTILLDTVNVSRRAWKASVLNGHISFDFSTDQLAATSATYVAAMARYDGSDTMYMLQARLNPDQTITLRLVSRVAGVESTIHEMTNVFGVTHAINTKYTIELLYWTHDGSTELKGRVYTTGSTAPDWQVYGTNAAVGLQVTGAAGVRTILVSGSTAAATTVKIDNYKCVNWGSGFRWNQLGAWGRLLSNPASTANQWVTTSVGWDQTNVHIPELMVATEYEFQIRAVDASNPPHESAWSASSLLTTATDNLGPETPAAPEVVGSRIAVQVVHRLGAASGGTYNLAQDLHHLEVHAGGPFFVPEEATRLGIINANSGHINGHIPVVQTFPVENTSDVWIKVVAVDKFGNKSSPSEATQAVPVLIDSAHISDLTASKITAGTLLADILLGARIMTASQGRRVEINEDGIQLYDAEGDLIISITADDNPNFISMRDETGTVTLSSMDANGNVNGQTLSAAQDVLIAGESFLDYYYDPLPRGVVAYGEWTDTTSIPATGSGSGNETGFLELSFEAVAGRRYQVACECQLISSSVNEEFAMQLRDGGESTPTNSSTRLMRYEVIQGGEAFAVNARLVYTGEFTEGLHRLLWTFWGFDGTAEIYLNNQKATFTIEDIGSAALVTNTATRNTGNPLIPAPPPNTNFIKTYQADWEQTYKGNNERLGGADNVTQGQLNSSDGNTKGLFGFDSTKIRNDLEGATITGCWITLNAEHWANTNGGTAVIGTHDYADEPSTWSIGRVNGDRVRSEDWPRGQLRTVDLGTTIGDEFRTGVSKGIAMGPGPDTTLEYYGRFSGDDAEPSSHRPLLRIAYRK